MGLPLLYSNVATMSDAQRLKMVQQQKLTPQQILLMRLLQVPASSMEQTLKDAVEHNPMLEEVEPLPTDGVEEYGQVDDEGVDDDRNPFEDGFNGDADDDDYAYRERQEYDPNVREQRWEVSGGTSLAERLMEQFHIKSITPREAVIGDEIIGSIDGAGYLGRDIALIANDLAYRQGIEVSPQEVEQVLKLVQNLDPAGIGARNLQECLSLQLHRLEPQTFDTRCAIAVIDRCFDDFSRHNYDTIQERLDIDDEAMKAAMECILRLNPKPGSGVSDSSPVPYVTPDFLVVVNDGVLTVTVNDSCLPTLRVSPQYSDMLQELSAVAKPTEEERKTIQFIRSNSDSARTFIGMLQQRHLTLQSIMEAIAKRQYAYFVTGNEMDLLPMSQRDIAQDTGYSDSVVSRVVNNKYVQTSFSTVLLKDLFSKQVINAHGEAVASKQVEQLLLKAIEEEDKAAPLSDDALADRLKTEGFRLSRRTVVRYRQSLGIPASRLRRMLKVVVLMVLCGISQALSAQTMGYYDSLHYAKIRQAKPAKKAPTSKENVASPLAKRPQTVDTALRDGDELIDKIYKDGLVIPSILWYGSNFSDHRVRLQSFSMDSLPDEVSIRLVKNSSEFCFPVKNVITSPYGWRWNRPHRGVDIRLTTGTPVHCAFDGVVRIARPMGAYGNLVVVRHHNGLETVYGHLSKIGVKPHQAVKAGDVLGLGGSTGRSTGPHLHFEVRFQYEAFDPEWILDFNNYTLRTRRLHLDKTYFGITKPQGKGQMVYKADKSIIKETTTENRKRPKPVMYKVKKGDRLSKIADRYGTTSEKIKALNSPWDRLVVGEEIRVR